MSISFEPKRCAQCGGVIPSEAPQGLCPKCLLLQASIPTEAGQGSTTKPTPPTREELTAAFPQLEILELIGQGGMGFVFKSRQPKLDRLVALKILPQSLAADPAFAERFTREGRVLARLNHPNIVTIHDFGQANGFFYLLMEFVDGVNLRQAMKVGRFTPAQALAIVPKICEALQFAHNEGILHRDIKPENILLDSKGRVKIADFGIAKLLGAEARSSFGVPPSGGPDRLKPELQTTNLTETGKVLGTPSYMAPEQIEKPGEVDHRADIYSLGVVFYEMLTGELPIGRFAPPSEKSGADPRVDEVVLHTLEKERERRTQTAGEVKTQVETISAAPQPGSSRREEAQTEGRGPTVSQPRFSRTAIVGASLAPFFFITLALWLIAYFAFQHRPFPSVGPSPFPMLALLPTPLGMAAFFGTTILGWVAVSQIRHSSGKLCGLGLAVFDGLLFPLLALNGITFFSFGTVFGPLAQDWIVRHGGSSGSAAGWWGVILSGVALIVVVDFLIIRRVWRAVNRPIHGAQGSTTNPPIAAPVRSSAGAWKIAVVIVAGVMLILSLPVGLFLLARLSYQGSHISTRQEQAASVQQSKPVSDLAFGPVIERVINVSTTGANCLIGFKSGQLNTPPPDVSNSAPALLHWARRAGVDAGLTVIGQGRVLQGYDLAVLPAPSECWEKLTPSEAAARLDALPVETFTTLLIAVNPDTPPATCVFKTRERGMGILQITGFTSEPAGVKVRYKFLAKGPETPTIQSPMTAAESWSPTLWPGEKPDLHKILEEARRLTETGHFEEALQRYLWHHHYALEFGSPYEKAVRLSSALSDWAELGRRYPKAKRALIEIRDGKTREIAEGRGYSELFQEVQAINRNLEDDDATYALFKTIREKDPQLASQCYFYLEELLVAKGEYQWCFDKMGDPQTRFDLIRRTFEMQRDSPNGIRAIPLRTARVTAEMNQPRAPANPGLPPDSSGMMKRHAEDRFVRQTCQLIEILVATDHKSAADKIRDQAVAVLDDPRLQTAVTDAEKKITK